ncbi:receiver/sensor box protein (plasmid) [Haloferax gibbonsii]|uniref:histidine kinase n=2 Tax=Haloferax TaxID=2251 RepID=A0A871BL70_HALGI|nr:PAS domain S-box protein [Haloferax gibbonsii]QOS13530.1 receiver/sensor box protein [Haloferax gibbonsii]
MDSLPPKIRVLHVDDEPDLAELTAVFLSREDDRFVIDSETNVSDGLEAFSEREYHCIVSDYDMPGQSGLDFLNTIRETHPRIPFILYTGKGSEAVASDAISAGVTDYLQKDTGSSQYTILANRVKNAVASYNAQETIRETEQRFSELAENSDDILFSFTADWDELLFINSAFEEIWGIPAEALEDTPDAFLAHIHENDREKALASMEKLSNGTPDEIEYRVIHPKLGVRWVHGQSKPILDEKGSVARIVGYVQDVTAYKKDHGLRVIETATEGISLVGPDGTFSYVNPAFASLFGYERSELNGRSWKVLYQDGEADRLERNILPGVSKHGYWSGETVRLTKQGDRLVTDHRLAKTGSGSIVCTAQDLTRERSTTTKPGEFYHLFEMTDGSAFYTLDHEGYVTRWNDHARDLLGYSVEDVLGFHLETLLSSESADGSHAESFIESARKDGEVTAEVEWHRSDGSTFAAPMTIIASHTPEGTIRGFGVILAPEEAASVPT